MAAHYSSQCTLCPHNTKVSVGSCPTKTADLTQFMFLLKGLITINSLANMERCITQVALEYSIHFNSILAPRHSNRSRENFRKWRHTTVCIKSGYPNSKWLSNKELEWEGQFSLWCLPAFPVLGNAEYNTALIWHLVPLQMVLILPTNKSLYSPFTDSHCGARADVEDILVSFHKRVCTGSTTCVSKKSKTWILQLMLLSLTEQPMLWQSFAVHFPKRHAKPGLANHITGTGKVNNVLLIITLLLKTTGNHRN